MGNNCIMSIDGTDFRILQTGTAIRGNAFASHKYLGKSALRYEIGVSILGGDLVWIQGPYPAGAFNDVKIFNKVLRHFLEPGERVKADKVSRQPLQPRCQRGEAVPRPLSSRDDKRTLQDLGNPVPGLPARHHPSRRGVLGGCDHHATRHRKWQPLLSGRLRGLAGGGG
jgi:hypothetical protein